MNKNPPAKTPDEYVATLSGWRRVLVEKLLTAVKAVDGLEETIKWGHLVYSFEGPVLLIRAEEDRVLFGFWRGKLLQKIEPRLRASGKYEMATLEFREETEIDPEIATRLVREAVALNQELGDPRLAAKK